MKALPQHRFDRQMLAKLGRLTDGAIETRARTSSMLKEFIDFIMRGNVVDLAVAVVIGAAFAAKCALAKPADVVLLEEIRDLLARRAVSVALATQVA